MEEPKGRAGTSSMPLGCVVKARETTRERIGSLSKGAGLVSTTSACYLEWLVIVILFHTIRVIGRSVGAIDRRREAAVFEELCRRDLEGVEESDL